MKVITFNLPEAQLEQLDEMHGEDKQYSSRSDAIRTAVRDWIKKQMPFIKKKLKESPEKVSEEPELEEGETKLEKDKLRVGSKVFNLKSLI